MSIVLRPGTAADAVARGTICYEAFKAICTAHNFPPVFPSPEVARGLLSMLLAHPVVAESEGRIVGDERSCIAGQGFRHVGRVRRTIVPACRTSDRSRFNRGARPALAAGSVSAITPKAGIMLRCGK